LLSPWSTITAPPEFKGEAHVAGSVSLNGKAFEIPSYYEKGVLRRLGNEIHMLFGFELDPVAPPCSFEEITARQLAGWIWSTIQQLRQSNNLPFEAGHHAALAAALRAQGCRLPEDPSFGYELKRCLPPAEFRDRWRKLGDDLGIKMPRNGVSKFGLLLSFGIAAALYVIFLQWFSANVHPTLIFNRLKWTFFIAAILLGLGISRVLALFLPGLPMGYDTSGSLAGHMAHEKPLAPDSAGAWNEELVWRKTRSLIARVFNVPENSVNPDTALSALASFECVFDIFPLNAKGWRWGPGVRLCVI
jgi:hypothetical protein